jgi:hypothetical protein
VRAAGLLAGLAGLVACTPEIGLGTYFCGPERLCPPDQACDEISWTCVHPLWAEPFSCPAGSDTFEPDDERGAARDLGATSCERSSVLVGAVGCIAGADAVDYATFDLPELCSDEHRVVVTLRYPIALMPLAVDLVDGEGQVVASGALCTPPLDYSGQDRLCIEVAPTVQRYWTRVTPAADAVDCDGACAYNRYTLDVSFLAP